MNIYYNDKQGWFHKDTQLQFGDKIVNPQQPLQPSYCFLIKNTKTKAGPLIGILTSGTENGKIFGDFKRWAQLQEELQQSGGISFLFTPFSLQEDKIYGYVYLINLKRWRKCTMPYPDIVYNRVPYRTHEKLSSVQQALLHFQQKHIPVFNPSFFSKWQVYETLQANSYLQSFLPHTRLLRTEHDLEIMLLQHKKLYIKSCESAKGKHLFTLEQLQNGRLIRQNIKEVPIETNMKDVYRFLSTSSHSYLAQQTIKVAMYKGRPYDLRVLVQYVRHAFTVTGIGVRVAPKNGIATHVPNGGEIISIEQLKYPIDIKLIARIASECGYTLMQKFGNIKEFSIDIGIEQNGHYYIFEINAKPMIFDEPLIQRQAVKNLLNIFEEEAGFSSSN
ncbi:YheC/YheD family protein [Bacillus sp. 165]|uniref:YheC/YheD family endospore coat-associated protein n=1 Tax=Bacillus sp. 165 TaxID=1529117 RepID=UPI001AD9D4BD|nr:YheC/YheD family protein [Bacillus sp. 165]MBO9128751.1 YheC/YheD family protein [Bacillus sp. 165]